MELSFSTNAFTRFPLDRAIAAIARTGYSGVEILCDVPHLFPPTFGRRDVAGLRRTLKAAGLSVANLNANTAVGFYGDLRLEEPLFEPSLCNASERLRRWRVDYTRHAIDIAADLGCPSVCVTAGRASPGNPPEVAMERLLRSLSEVCRHAGERGVRVGLEYEPGLLVENTAEFLDLHGRLGSPVLGANLDVGHAAVVGEDVAASIRRLGDRIVHVHIEDIRNGKHYHRIPGEGDLDFPGMFAALSEVGYRGFLSVELYTCAAAPTASARRALRYLRPLLGAVNPVAAGAERPGTPPGELGADR